MDMDDEALADLLAARLAARLERLPHAELARLAAKALVRCPSVMREAERTLTVHAPVPSWAVDEVLLHPDLVPSLMATLRTPDVAARQVCTAWRRGWDDSLVARRILHKASSQPPRIFTSTHSITASPSGERVYVVGLTGVADEPGLYVLDRNLGANHCIEIAGAHLREDEDHSVLATEHGLVIFSTDGILRRLQVSDDLTVTQLAECVDEGETYAVADGGNGELFISSFGNEDDDGGDILSGYREQIVVRDAQTLQVLRRFSDRERFRDIRGLCVAGDEVVVIDIEDDESRLLFYSTAGAFLREAQGDWGASCFVLHHNGRLYLMEHANIEGGGSYVHVLTLTGETIQTYHSNVPLSYCFGHCDERLFVGGLSGRFVVLEGI